MGTLERAGKETEGDTHHHQHDTKRKRRKNVYVRSGNEPITNVGRLAETDAPVGTTNQGKRYYLKAFFIGLAAIIVWRGVWLLLDLYLFPQNLTASAVISISAGMLLFVLYGEIRL